MAIAISTDILPLPVKKSRPFRVPASAGVVYERASRLLLIDAITNLKHQLKLEL
jgi:hypothetical protein